MKIFKGVIVPMVSPLRENLSIDTEAVERLVESFVEHESAPFVLGTTGEFASFSAAQRLDLVKATVSATKGRIKTFAGISGTSLYESIESAKAYKDLGIDVMVTTLPYYYPITPDEMLRFFTQLADALDCPIVLYNMPAMVGEKIPLEIAEVLSKHPNIAGMKDSERDDDRINQSIDLWKDRDDFAFYLGWAARSAHSVLRGADGIVPSTANFVPALYKALYDAAVANDEKKSFDLQKVTDELSLIYQKDRKLNTSLPALKVLMNEMGLCESHVMPPMYNIVQDEQLILKSQIRDALNRVLKD